jgi:hypothetical protein
MGRNGVGVQRNERVISSFPKENGVTPTQFERSVGRPLRRSGVEFHLKLQNSAQQRTK